MLSSQCKREGINRKDYFKSWVNIKLVFSDFYHSKAMGMAGMLRVTKCIDFIYDFQVFKYRIGRKASQWNSRLQKYFESG